MLPRRSCYEMALAWLRQRAGDGEDDKLMVPAVQLHNYFPGGPTSVDEGMIDVVAVTISSMYSVLYPIPYPTDFCLVWDIGSSDSLNRFREEITFLVPRDNGEPDWLEVVHLNNYLDRPSYPQFVENVVQRPRRAADGGNSKAPVKMVVSYLKTYLLNC